jgi:ubiquinone/menaquinone biosynthesis C-methylase UbiE
MNRKPAYATLADWFEYLNDDCGYENWSQYLIMKLKKYPVSDGLDIGCGGGWFTRAFVKAGYKTTGLDSSAEMLDFAQETAMKHGTRSEYLLGDISKEEYLSEKVRFSKREERLSEMEKALHFAVSEEGFFREIVDFVVVYENWAEVRLKSSERIFSFVISRNGREYSVDLNDIQQNKRK